VKPLAYVFWHRPSPAVTVGDYEQRLTRFHAALAADPPAGFRNSCALQLTAAPWLPGDGPAYEDWYLVDGWAALGVLNVHAVSGSRAAPHDAAAHAAAAGTAGVYALLAGPPRPPALPHGVRAAKPPGLAYADFHARLAAALPEGASAWQRQMTLGPAGEYLIRAPVELALPWPAEPAPGRPL
jgi:hypothetical protein